MAPKPICFVIQGFGEKVDLATGSTYDLDASYAVIKEAVTDAGVECVRADEIVHSRIIDVPMYESLHTADLVIADLTTSNPNALYELGIRYGVRPYATIVVADKAFKSPFDTNHILIRRYEHLGKDIGAREAKRFKQDLVDAIHTILPKHDTDSPFYLFVPLDPPTPRPVAQQLSVAAPPSPPPPTSPSAKELLDQARAAMGKEDFAKARELFKQIYTLRPQDTFVLQQLALATYKSKQPDSLTALKEASDLLLRLDPNHTNDPETLGLWGAVHKRLWEMSSVRNDLDTSIAAYERGFYLKQDYYNGINLAYLLNVRSALLDDAGETAEAVTDFVIAGRVRRDVEKYSMTALKALPESYADATSGDQSVAAERYWILATLWEAAVGLEDAATAAQWKEKAMNAAVQSWMTKSTLEQIGKLEVLLANSPLRKL